MSPEYKVRIQYEWKSGKGGTANIPSRGENGKWAVQ